MHAFIHNSYQGLLNFTNHKNHTIAFGIIQIPNAIVRIFILLVRFLIELYSGRSD